MLSQARILLAIVCLATLPGCGTLYLAQAARGQWQVMHERRPISEVLADPATSEALRARLSEVRAARDFASRELGLPDNGSYRSYSELGRPYAVWNVIATPELSVEPHRWCFPIAGCVPYRGYFREESARRFAAELRSRGFDVIVGGVAAYSTLGRLADPVLDTMLRYGDTELAAIIFHELAHQVVYIPGDAAFNEAFAVTVEQAGLERWLAQRDRRDQYVEYTARRRRLEEYVRLFERRRRELARLYASDLPPETKRQRKAALFAALAADVRELEERHGIPSPYRGWLEEGLNNAHLASVATYFDCVPGFERLLEEQEGDLPRFYDAVRRLAALPGRERRARLCSAAPDRQLVSAGGSD